MSEPQVFYPSAKPTLEEAQAMVGGYVELITLANGSQMLMDEDGHRKKLPHNLVAMDLAKFVHHIVGPVVILSGSNRWT